MTITAPNDFDYTLAEMVALRLDGTTDTCPAWLETAERRCGRAVTVGLLCARHHTVAEKRWEKFLKKGAAEHRQQRARDAARLPLAETELAEVELRYAQLCPSSGDDGAVVNLPLAKRMPSDSRIAELARLAERRGQLAREVAHLQEVVA